MATNLVPMSFSEATHHRRTYRTLDAKSPVPDSTLIKIAQSAILDVPSAFNNQATRLTMLFGDDHKKLWSMTGDTLRARIGEERWEGGTKGRIEGFAGAYGTILFWDDLDVQKKLNENSPDIYKDKTDEWIHQANGMHQYYLWVALEALGFGVNLQHYNPLIDDQVHKTWNIPSDWKLRAQMTYGIPKSSSEPAGKEQKVPVEQRVTVHGTEAKL